MSPPQFNIGRDDGTAAGALLGRFEASATALPRVADTVSAGQTDHIPNSQSFISDEYIKPYRPHNARRFNETRNDFQIGSVVLPVPPLEISVRRIRDVMTMPVIRGHSVNAKSGEGIISIDISFDIPDFTDFGGDINPFAAMLAELKTCPFTVIRNRGLSAKVSQSDLEGLPEITEEALLNINVFEQHRTNLWRLLNTFLNPVNQYGIDVSAPWQRQLRFDFDRDINPTRFIAPSEFDVDRPPHIDDDGDLANILITRVDEALRSNEDDPNYGRSQFGARVWDALKAKLTNEEFVRNLRDAATGFANAARKQRLIKERAQKAAANDKYTPPPKFIPVALQRVAFSTIPGQPGRARVDMNFELFNYTAYVGRFLWHSFRGKDLGWGYTDDPAEADLLLRWRDSQFLDWRGSITAKGFVPIANLDLDDLNRTYRLQTKDISLGTEMPGYFRYLREAWRNRRCRTPSSKPEDHKLRIFYPESVPQIKSSLPQETGSFYNKIVVDSGTHPKVEDMGIDGGGIIRAVQVVWQLSMARQIDEATGLVRHQWAGGSQLEARFEVCVPTEQGDRPRDEVLLGQINRMYNTIERSRKLLPSEGFIPTTIFIQNPITELFGAYCFEATDIPIRQNSPGKIEMSMQFTETLPVVGLGEHLESPTSEVTSEEFFHVVSALANVRDRFRSRYLINDTSVLGVLAQSIGIPGINQPRKPEGVKKELTDLGFPGLVFQFLRNRGLIPKELEPNPILGNITLPEFLLQIQSGRVGNYKPISDEYTRIYDWYGSRYLPGFVASRDLPSRNWVNMMRDCFVIVVINFIVSGIRITEAKEVYPYPMQDPISLIENLLFEDLFHSTNRSGALERAKVVVKHFYTPSGTFRRDASKAIEYALIDAEYSTRGGRDQVVRELVSEGVVPALSTDAYVDRLLDLARETELERATKPITAQLYPDMVLPTYAELFGLNPDAVNQSANDVLTEHLTRFIPSFNECGIIRRDAASGNLPSRNLNDIADPDVWFYRDPFMPPQIYDDWSDVYYRRNDTYFVNPGEKSPTIENGQKGTEFAPARTRDQDDAAAMGKSTRESMIDQSNLEQQLTPNKRRMLYAFPTYSMEFYIEGTQARPLFETGALPFNWEARIINNLPLLNLEIFEDPYIPCQAEVTFIARKAALRNESWRWLDPLPEIDTDTFTNNPEKVRQFLYNRKSIASDPTFLTKLALTPGARVTVRIGYGTDLNNSRTLPIKIAGTIGKISLGEVSRMTIQSLGTQLINPVTANIGGSGWWSPNRIWNGKYTLRAFTDIFQNLSTRYMGRRQTGLVEDDIRDLTDTELERIWRIGVVTRNTAELIASDKATPWMINFASYIAMGPRVSQLVNKLFFGTATAGSKLQDLMFDPASRVFPEMLNVYPAVTGVSDWAISNTEGKSLPGVYWLDMIARLNPGAIWWPHPYGGECRLFFGRPDQMYRESPIPISAEDYSLLEKASIAEINANAKDPIDRLWEDTTDLRSRARVVVTIPEEGDPIIQTNGHEIVYTDSATTPLDELVQEYIERLRTRFRTTYFSGTVEAFSWGGNQERVNIEYGVLSRSRARQITNELSGILRPEVFNQVMAGVLTRHNNEMSFLLRGGDAQSEDLILHDNFAQFGAILRTVQTDFPGDDYSQARFWVRLAGYAKQDLIRDLEDNGLESFQTTLTDDQLIFLHERVREVAIVLRELLNADYLDTLLGIVQLGQQLQRLRHAAGYRRFRRHHFTMSGAGLLSNRLEVGQDTMANAVSVDGYVIGYNVLPEERRVMDLDGDIDNLNFGIFQWIKGRLGENDRNRVLSILIPNALSQGLSKMYSGTIELAGDPAIKPYDIIYMLDLHNGIYGPVKACSVIHTLNPQSGYTTLVRPQMHTQSFTSKALTEHVVGQRILGTTAAAALVGGIVGFAFGGPAGALVGFGGAVLAAGLFTFAEVRDSIGRARLTNFSFAEALAGSHNKEQMEAVIRALIVDGYIASNNVSVISPVFDQTMVHRLTNLEQPELGVQAFPLIRLGTGTPLVAGMRSAGIIDIDPSVTGVLEESIVETAVQEIDNFKYIVGNFSQDAVNGWSTITNALRRRLDTSEANRRALERRGLRTQD